MLKLGFLADFLSRTLLIGFFTGVGFQVGIAAGEPPDSLMGEEDRKQRLHHRLDRMNRYGLLNLKRRVFSDVQLQVVRLYRANGTFKGRFNPYPRISNIAYQEVRT